MENRRMRRTVINSEQESSMKLRVSPFEQALYIILVFCTMCLSVWKKHMPCSLQQLSCNYQIFTYTYVFCYSFKYKEGQIVCMGQSLI